jgi:FkbM family methyltransferase
MRRLPWYQAAVQSLPYGKDRAARAIGTLLGQKVRAVVNDACFELNLNEVIQRKMFLDSYEPIETGWFRECVNKGDVIIDVGASFGHYTSLGASLVGTTGRVFAFEPSPVASQVLLGMIRDSGIDNIVLTRAAVGRANGAVDLFLPTTSYLHSPSIVNSDPTFVPHRIPVVALDEFEAIQPINEIKLMKIDVEGYEPDVLDGMERMLHAKKVQNIFCEFNSWWLERNGTTTERLLERFLDFGYIIHRQTELQTDLVGHQGARFNLQDIWFKQASGTG